MAQGDVSNAVTSGGQLPPNSALQARTVIALGCSPLGTVNTLLNLSSAPGIVAGLDTGALADYSAKLLQHGAGAAYALPVNPSTAGGVSAAVTQVGYGLGTVTPSVAPHKAILFAVTTAGALGTMKGKFSLDGGTTYGPIVTSAAGWASTGYFVPGTYCTLTMGAATYVISSTITVGVDGTIGAWTNSGTGTVAILAAGTSPIDNYNVKVTIGNGGAVGTATASISLDNGLSQLPSAFIASGGVVVIPNTGIVLTFANNGGTFTSGDTYSFNTAGPTFVAADITAAINAVRSLSTTPTVALCHVIGFPYLSTIQSAAASIGLAGTLDSALTTLATSQYGRNWIGMVECPSKSAGDVVVNSSQQAVVDSADTDAVIRAARYAGDLKRVSVCVATQNQQNVLNSYQLRRPVGWGLAARYVEADPSSDPSAVVSGALDFVLVNGALSRDEFAASVTLYDAQYNVIKTYANRAGAYLTIESGGVGWRNMNTLQGWQDANFIRVLNVFLAAITSAGQKYLGTRQSTNPDGTITTRAASIITSDLDNIAKLSVGLTKGGAFVTTQASAASAVVLATSQLGSAPKRLDIQYTLQSLGFVSAVSDSISIS